jgi:hypothetical protein
MWKFPAGNYLPVSISCERARTVEPLAAEVDFVEIMILFCYLYGRGAFYAPFFVVKSNLKELQCIGPICVKISFTIL